MMNKLFLGLGANLGNKGKNIELALAQIGSKIGTIMSQSSLYTTKAWGYDSENLFFNLVVEVDTTKTPFEVLEIIKKIEIYLGREKKTINGIYSDRLIDIDILFYNDSVIDTDDLKIPHPLLAERLFVLEPMSEIAPEWQHPVLHKSINELKLRYNV